MKIPVSWLKDYVDVKIPARELADKLTMAGLEVTSIEERAGEEVFEIEITSNRPDLLCLSGVAREVAAITGKKLRLQFTVYGLPGKKEKPLLVSIEDKKGCARYVGTVIGGVKVGPSPKWLVERLGAVGCRSVNNVVDITNYVLFELGQPLHAFDYDKLCGQRIIVRRAIRGEELTTIDREKRTLDEETLVIADENRPIAIAGIMGGIDTEVNEGTGTIMLEAAWFEPITIRRTSKRLGLSSESSYRFERNVDLEGVLRASRRAAQLIVELCGGEIVSSADAGKKEVPSRPILLRPERLDRVLGTRVPMQKAATILTSLGFDVKKGAGGALRVSAPSHRRQDVTREADLIEEVARIWGYDKIPVSLPKGALEERQRKSPARVVEELAKETLVGLGLDETITYSLISEDLFRRTRFDTSNAVSLKNPLSAEQALMRTSLLPGMLTAVARNLNRKNVDLKIFEAGKTFCRCPHPAERTSLAIVITGARYEDWQRKPAEVDLFDLKGIFEALFERLGIKNAKYEYHPYPFLSQDASAKVEVHRKTVGFIGRVNGEALSALDIEQDVFAGELDLDALLALAQTKRSYAALPKYPSIVRDISIFVPAGTLCDKIVGVIRETGGELVKGVRLFDRYKGENLPQGQKSLAYSIEYQRRDRTLTDEEVNTVHSGICQALSEKLGARLR